MSVAWVHVLGACSGPRLMSVSQLLFSLFTEAILPMNLNSLIHLVYLAVLPKSFLRSLSGFYVGSDDLSSVYPIPTSL